MPDFSNGGVYPAIKADFRCIGATGVDLRFLLADPFLIADIPIALLVDTAYLPWDATETEFDRFERMYPSGNESKQTTKDKGTLNSADKKLEKDELSDQKLKK